MPTETKQSICLAEVATYHGIDKDILHKTHICLHFCSLFICQVTAKTVTLYTQ